MAKRDLLGEIFATPEYQVRTFMDVIRPDVTYESPEQARDAAVKGLGMTETEKVRPSASSIMQTSGLIQIERVSHGDDIAWHVAPAHTKCPWKVSDDRVIFSIIKVMSSVIPKTVKVDIALPYHDPEGKWQIREMTFKARGLKGLWNVSPSDLDRMTEKLFDVLNKLV